MKIAGLEIAGLLALASCFVACAPPRIVVPLRYAPTAEASPDDPLRAVVPPRSLVSEIVDGEPRVTTLPNGMRVMLFERHEFPTIAARLLIDRGALDLGDAGLRVAQMMSLYVRGGNEAQFERLLEDPARVGTRYGSGMSGAALWFEASGPPASLDATLEMLSRMTFKAQLTADEYQSRKADWNEVAGAGAVSLASAERLVLFGENHPYGHAGHGGEGLPMRTAQTIHDRLLQPAQATLVVVGDVAPETLDASVAHVFGEWAATDPLPARSDEPPRRTLKEAARISIVAHHGLAQIRAAVFARGPVPSSDDIVTFALLADLLGGGKSSRLFEHLREDTGDVYAAGAQLVLERGASWIALSGSYDADKAVDGVASVLGAVDDLRAGKVTDEDMDVARETVLADWRGSMAVASEAAAGYALWISLGPGPDAMRTFPARLAKVTRDDLVRVANQYLTSGALHVVFLGENRWLYPQSLGMGDAELLDLSK